jgi:tetratricopeptide (TPR) repeat protein
MRLPHSTERGTVKKMRLDPGRRKSVGSGLAVLLLAVLLAPAAALRAADTHWLDIESRIQYGYYTEDPRALRNLVQPLAADDSTDALKSYYGGLLAYRLTLLAEAQADQSATAGKLPTAAEKNEMRQTAERCVAALDHALTVRSDFPDALALQSACLGRLAELSSLRAPFAAAKSASQMRKALQQAPRNPRVLLLEAIGTYEHAKAGAGDAEHPCEKFKNAAAVFEAERADVDQVPGWGAAEAYTWLGRCYLDKGDAVAARDPLERALLIAPEFAWAHRLLASITSSG